LEANKEVLYGCETWSVTMSEEHRLRMSENKVVARIYGMETKYDKGRWRNSHSQEFYKNVK